MNPWIAKALVLAATVVMIAIRAPHGHGSRRVKVIKSHKTPLEAVLLILAWVGFFVPLISIASPALSFAEYSLHSGPLISGGGLSVTIETVPYEFQRGGNQLMRVQVQSSNGGSSRTIGY